MATSRSTAGDPARTLELLWREPGSTRQSGRGPKQSHNLDEVIDTAIGIADESGLDGVTMRSVAQALRVAPMSIYTYVPGKAELLDLMLDAVYRAMPRPSYDGKDWRERVTSVARANWDLVMAHPWVATVATGRPVLGPGLMAKYDHELSAFDGLGLDDVTVDDALTYVLTFVQATARAAIDARAAARESAMSDAQWWEANAPLLARVFDESAFPTAARVGVAAGAAHGSAHDPEHTFEFGLARTLDGIAALIEEVNRAGRT
ncbi:MAG TPA: TetR/AcrR family transcriptional regulator [Actinopolymorphaceae bacterium]